MSDHDGIPIITINLCPKRSKQKPRGKIHLFHKADLEGMKQELKSFCQNFVSMRSPGESVEVLWCEFKDELLSTMDKFIPSKIVNRQNKPPWINNKVKNKLKQKQRAYNRARKSNSTEDWNSFREKRKDTHKVLRASHRRYIRDFCMESKKQFLSFVKNMRKDASGIQALKNQGVLVSDNKTKAELLNAQFKSVFTGEDMSALPDLVSKNIPSIPDIIVSTDGVEKLLKNLNPNKATGPDGISPRVLREFASEIAPILTIIFQTSIDSGTIPKDWKNANISPIHKKGDRTKASNYRPVSLTSVSCKLCEHIIHSHIMEFLDKHKILTTSQHGFRSGHSCETQYRPSTTTLFQLWITKPKPMSS